MTSIRTSPSGPLIEVPTIEPGNALGDVPTWNGTKYVPEQPSSGPDVQAISLLAGLPYVFTTNPAVDPILTVTLENVQDGDKIVINSYTEVQNEAVATREIHASHLVNGVSVQDSTATKYAATGDVGDTGPFVMSIAFNATPPDIGTVVIGLRLYASDVDVVGPQVFLSVSNLGQ